MKRRVAKHGSITGYFTLKCRCSKCRQAARDYMRAFRAKVRTEAERKFEHGTVNAYTNYACRCSKCRQAKAKSQREAKAKSQRKAKATGAAAQ